MSDDLKQFLADKWKIKPGPGGPVYQLMQDMAWAVAFAMDTRDERQAALDYLAGELIAQGLGAGLDLGELRGLEWALTTRMDKELEKLWDAANERPI